MLTRGSPSELVLGARMSESGNKALARALAANHSLRKLSFAGSHMGEERLEVCERGGRWGVGVGGDHARACLRT